MSAVDRPQPQRRLLLRAAGVLALLLRARAVPAAEPERSVKAAFLLKFVGYLEFGARGPAPGEPLVIAVSTPRARSRYAFFMTTMPWPACTCCSSAAASPSVPNACCKLARARARSA
jgi:hypothetical protein